MVQVSDQHFGKGSNLILPGRGNDMSDGWETKRSRVKGHTEWAVILLCDVLSLVDSRLDCSCEIDRGCPGVLDHIEIDTNHFMGNYPESVEVHACSSTEVSVATPPRVLHLTELPTQRPHQEKT